MALFTKWTKNLRFMAIQPSYFYVFLPPWDGRNSHDPNIGDGPRNSEDREPVSVASWTPCSRCFSYGRPKRQANLIERNIHFFAFIHHFTSILHPFYIHFYIHFTSIYIHFPWFSHSPPIVSPNISPSIPRCQHSGPGFTSSRKAADHMPGILTSKSAGTSSARNSGLVSWYHIPTYGGFLKWGIPKMVGL